jgi:predicted component of type VI protein secretion system
VLYTISVKTRLNKRKTRISAGLSVAEMEGFEPTRIKRYMREMQYLSGLFVLFSRTKGIKNTLSE